MKRVAILGADFAPSSLPQALRMRFFAGHLAEFGWEPTIITTDPRYYECPIDRENERLLPSTLRIVRTPALPARMTRIFGVGDIGLRSMWYHWRVLARLCRLGLVDLLCIPVPPYVPMLLGRIIRAQFGIPYVIDYGDPWVSEYYWKLPKSKRPPKWALAYSLSRILEPIALRRVSHIVGVSKGTTENVTSRYSWLANVDTSEIPHGGEPADFEYLRAHPRSHSLFDRNDGFLHISYVGAVVSAMLDTVRALFAAVRQGLDREPGLFRRLRLHFVGTTYSPHSDHHYAVLPIAQELGIGSQVEEQPGRVGHLDALQLLLDSHALVILGSEEQHYTPSKVFPYILAKRPLLAILHEASSAVEILRETTAGEVVSFGPQCPPSRHVAAISLHLEHILSLPPNYEPPTRWDAFEAYTTTAAARKLALVFDDAVKAARTNPRR